VDGLRGDLLNLATEKMKVAPVVEPRQDFFIWVGELSGIAPGAVELGAAIVPAIIIDIAGPV